jgi:AcrR family transcriptional regulator
MKVSQSTKERTRLAILQAAVELMTAKGYKNTSMREIAENAGVSNPTIYNYFATKERIIGAYIEEKHREAIALLQEIDGFHTFTLREQLQSLLETELELYLEDREFMLQIAEVAFHESGFKLEVLYETRTLFTQAVSEILDAAVESGKIVKPPFASYLPQLFWDYFVVIVAYWVRDTSDHFARTTEFVDRSMGLVEAVLDSDVLGRATDFGLFLFKTHLMGALMRPKTGDLLKGLREKLRERHDG